jgi:hypothetical protein
MNSSYDGEYTIRVQNGGALYVLSNSKITAKDIAKRYNLIFEAGSYGSIESSKIEYTYGDPNNPNSTGFIVNTDNFIIKDSTIQNSGSNGLLISGEAENFLVDNCTIEGSALSGLVIQDGASGEVTNSHISSNETFGIVVSGESSAYIHDNNISNNGTANILCDNSNPIISDNIIASSETGIIIQNNANPNLGNLENTDPRDDGGNTFLNHTDNAIKNTTPNTIKLENNSWEPAQQITLDGGVTLNIPSGAASQTVVITLETSGTLPGILPNNKKLVSSLHTIHSNVTTFSLPVSITIPVENGHFGTHPYFWNGSTWSCAGLDAVTITTTPGASSMTFTTSQINNLSFAALANIISVSTPIAAPNPFNPNTQTTKLIYWLDAAADTRVYIFDLTGNLIWQKSYTTTDTEGAHANYNQVEWNGSNLFGGKVENGIYMFKVLSGGRYIGSGKIIASK